MAAVSDDFDAAMGVAPAAKAGPDVLAIVRTKAAQYGIDPAMAERWARQESGLNPKLTSKRGAKGVLQLMDPTAKQYGVADPYDAETNIDGGMRYLSDLKKKYGDDERAFAAYNAGPVAVDKAGGVPNFPETQAYVKNIVGGAHDDFDVVMTGAHEVAASAPGGAPADAEAAYKDAFGDPGKLGAIKFTGMDQHSTKEQTQTFIQLKRGEALDEKAPLGSIRNPYGLQPGTTPKDVPAGAYYVPPEGGLKRAPGGEAKSSVLTGLQQGASDVLLSGAQLMPGTDDSSLALALKARQMGYDADYKGDFRSGTGRFLGQVAASAPLIAGAEAAVAPALAGSPMGAFVLGEGGQAMAPGLARVGTRGASLAARGAAEGGAAAGLVSSTNDAPLGEQVLTGAEFGGLLGPLAPAAGAAGRWAGRTARGLTEPLTFGGREKMATRAIEQFGAGGPMTGNPAEIVPGSVPTLAQATGNPGIATLERTVRNARPTPFADRSAQNNEARALVMDTLKGDETSLESLHQAREAATGGVRDKALATAAPADPTPVVAKIDEILAGPAGQRDVVVKALSTIRGKLDGERGPQTDAAQLYGIRKAIDDLLSPLASTDARGSQLASHELLDIKKELDKSIEAAAPGFKGYLKTYADMSKPIDEMKFLQSLNITDMRGNITLARMDSALKRIDKLRTQSGANPGKSISPDTMAQLHALREDLLRADNINLGRPLGSDTAQHLATGNIAAGMNVPLALGAGALMHHPMVGPAMGVGKMFYGKKNEQLLDQLTTRLLDPEMALNVTPAKPPSKVSGPLRRIGKVLLPVTAGVLSNSLVGP